MTHVLILGDCLEKIKELPENSVDSIVTDPPAGISFMGKEWDTDKGGRDNWITWMQGVATECKRVLKPGGHAFVWTIPRTSHWTATAWENAGFEIRDVVAHIFGSGFPKSANIQKHLQKMGNKRADEFSGWGTALKPAREDWILMRKPISEKNIAGNVLKWGTGGINIDESRVEGEQTPINKLVKWSGFGQEKRPDYVQVINNQGRFPANLIHDGSDEVKECFPETKSGKHTEKEHDRVAKGMFAGGIAADDNWYGDKGSAARFFKSIIYQAKASKSERNKGLDSIVLVDILRVWNESNTTKEEKLIRLVVTGISPQKVIAESGVQLKNANEWNTCLFGKHLMEKYQEDIKSITKTETNSITTSQTLNWLIYLLANEYTVGANLEMENGGNLVASAENSNTLTITINEAMALALGVKDVVSGMQLKINVKEGSNIHSTVKPIALMEYLINMITPKGGTVLDPFMGSGSTGVACKNLNRNFIGIELGEEYLKIAKARIENMPLTLL